MSDEISDVEEGDQERELGSDELGFSDDAVGCCGGEGVLVDKLESVYILMRSLLTSSLGTRD